MTAAKSEDAFRTIGEAAEELGLKTHVLRFWETKFEALKPMKRGDGRRYYRPEDMALLRTLQQLLHVQGLTIRGALKALGEANAGEAIAGEGVESGEADGAPAGDMAAGADAAFLHPEAGPSVRDLQDAVREAVERGDFRNEDALGDAAARRSLETLLADLVDLKSRLDRVRTAA
jgi:DNA-binding transcriptional MerR regulator